MVKLRSIFSPIIIIILFVSSNLLRNFSTLIELVNNNPIERELDEMPSTLICINKEKMYQPNYIIPIIYVLNAPDAIEKAKQSKQTKKKQTNETRHMPITISYQHKQQNKMNEKR